MKARSLAWMLLPAALVTGFGPTGSPHAPRREMPASDAPRPLPFHYDLYTFRGNGGGTTVVASIAVEAGDLASEQIEGRTRYLFDVRFVLADTARRSVTNSIDSVFLSRPAPLSGRNLLHTHVEIEAPPSETTLQRVVVTDAQRVGSGQLHTSAFAIPDYSGTDLMLSDLAFGLPGAGAGWSRRGVTLSLLPTSQFPESAFDVYYEVYNLPHGTPYETEITISRADPGEAPDPVHTGFSGESAAAEDDTIGELRRIASTLDEGRYRFDVTVRDLSSGRTASTSREVEVRGWRRGTTLVEARPYHSGAENLM